MSFSQEEAEKASGSTHLTDGGPHFVTITKAQFVKASTGTKGIEFSGETDDGLKVNYLTVYYEKHDGEKINGGRSVINAMMGFCGIKQITAVQNGQGQSGEPLYVCKEFEGKRLGLFLRKKLYTKNDNQDGFKFEIHVPFDPATNKTMREKTSNQPAKTISLMAASYKDQDERKIGGQSNTNHAPHVDTFDDDIPF